MYLQLMTHEGNEISIKKNSREWSDLQNCQIKYVYNETKLSQYKILEKK